MNNLFFFKIGIYLSIKQKVTIFITQKKRVFLLNAALFIGMEYLLIAKIIDARLFVLFLAISGSVFVLQVANMSFFILST